MSFQSFSFDFEDNIRKFHHLKQILIVGYNAVVHLVIFIRFRTFFDYFLALFELYWSIFHNFFE